MGSSVCILNDLWRRRDQHLWVALVMNNDSESLASCPAMPCNSAISLNIFPLSCIGLSRLITVIIFHFGCIYSLECIYIRRFVCRKGDALRTGQPVNLLTDRHLIDSTVSLNVSMLGAPQSTPRIILREFLKTHSLAKNNRFLGNKNNISLTRSFFLDSIAEHCCSYIVLLLLFLF